MDTIISSLVSNAPIAAAVLATVMLFLKRQKEQGDEFRTTLGQIIDTNSATNKAIADQVATLSHEVSRVVDRMDRAEFRAGSPLPAKRVE
jgi:hypothetical protein